MTWQFVLDLIQTQTDPATFEQHLRRTQAGDPVAGRLTVGTPSEASRAWLNARLRSVVERAAASVYGVEVEIEFVADGVAGSNGREGYVAVDAPEVGASPSPGEVVAKADYYSAYFGGKGKPKAAGYVMLPHYASQFWLPYLSDAFLLWRRLDSDSRVDLRQVENRWSEVQVVTYNNLANKLNFPHTRYISGQTLECSRSSRAISDTDQPIEKCSLLHDPIRTKIDHQGRPRCYYWHVGYLETLYDEKLIGIDVKKGTHPRNHTIQLQVWRFLPLLTPSQVDKLNGELKKDHQQWINDFGDRLGIDFAGWQRITEPTLVDLMEGYHEYKQLTEPHTFAADFLALPCQTRIGYGFTTPGT